MFPHLHLHSTYSFLDGLASPQELAQAAAQHGLSALALTDLHSLTGAIEFYDACQAAGVQPILGLELRVIPSPSKPGEGSGPGGEGAPPASLVLLATDLSGWASLCRLGSAVQDYADSLPFERLAQETNGLLCLTGGLRGLATQLVYQAETSAAEVWLAELANIFPGRLYIELQSHTPADAAANNRLARLAHTLRLPLVAAHNIHYLQPEQAELQRVVTAIRQIRPVKELPPDAAAPPGAYFLSPAEMQARFAHFPTALEATQEIAARCKLELPLGQPQFPQIPLSPGQSALDVLRQKACQGAQRLYGAITPQIQARLDHELEVIGECGYAVLFLIMQEILGFARQQGIPTASRGSSSSSLVAHCLGITSPEPLSLNLYFERFLNPARATPPDIDTDLDSQRRDEVIHFVYRRFGQDRTAMVATINCFRRRSALREVAKAFGLPPPAVSAMVEKLPERWYGPRRPEDKTQPYADLSREYTSPLHQAIFRHAQALIGLPHHLSIHPGGMIISPGPLNDLAPTQLAPKGILITQVDLASIARLGLVKIDLLGIRGLSVLGEVSGRMAPQAGLSNALDFLESIPEDDPLTAETIQHGRTIGCFQIESPGMRSTLREIQARSVDDLMVALALYRPGPLTGGLKTAFVRRHKGLEPVEHLHPALASLLAETHGVILYQEQVLQIAHEFAGLSLADADLLRRAMSHFDPGKQMQTLKEKFIAGAAQLHGAPSVTSERIWDLMAAFAGYGFPKAHAASYAQVGWRAAWCKTHYPALFMAAVLANWGGYYSQRVYLTEARRLGLGLGPPHINHALPEFSAQQIGDQPVLFMGLDQVRDLTRRTQARILKERPFHSLSDFLVRVDPRPQEAENLIQCGALEGLGTIPPMLAALKQERWGGGQLSLFQMPTAAEHADLDDADWSLAQKVAAQEAILGVGLIAHPLELVAEQIAASGALSTLEAAGHPGERVLVAGMRQIWRRSRARNNQVIYFMTLEDLEGSLEVMISAETYRRSRSALSGPGPYLIEGMLEIDPDQGEPRLRAGRIEAFRQP
jgi:DNA-directed DNA polymerase III PolC